MTSHLEESEVIMNKRRKVTFFIILWLETNVTVRHNTSLEVMHYNGPAIKLVGVAE
jgi:hypothetical protein